MYYFQPNISMAAIGISFWNKLVAKFYSEMTKLEVRKKKTFKLGKKQQE